MPKTFSDAVRESRAQTLYYEARAESYFKQASPNVEALTGGGGGLSFGGSQRDRQRYTMYRDWVHTCINAIATRVAGQPFNAGLLSGAMANPERRRKPDRHKRWLASKLPTIFKAHAEQELEVFTSHPVLDLLDQPNPVQGKFELIFMSIANMYLVGVSYWILDTKEDGTVEVWCPPSTWIQPEHKGGLFTGYRFKPPDKPGEGEFIDPENVLRMYFPDPGNIRTSVSPIDAQLLAIRSDSKILQSQDATFDNGIFPQVVLTVGDVDGPDGQKKRPKLKAWQRKQINAAVRSMYQGVVNSGNPLILDALIEKVEKLSRSPEEMDWMDSGKAVKARIFQAFGVNPIVVGEIEGVNRASAAEARFAFAENVINPRIDDISRGATKFLGPLFDPGKRLLIWMSPYESRDPEFRFKKLALGRARGDITRDELRAELGLPPMEGEETPFILQQAQGATIVRDVISQVTIGRIDRSSAVELLVELGIDRDRAEAMTPTFAAGTDGARTGVPYVKRSQPWRVTRDFVRELSLKQQGRASADVVRAMQRLFGQQVQAVADGLRSLSVRSPQYVEKDAARDALALVTPLLDPQKWHPKLVDLMGPVLGQLMAEGALSQILIGKHAVNQSVKQTSASEWLENQGSDLPPGIGLELPDWLIDAANQELRATFLEPYWLRIHETTRDDILSTVAGGIERGLSIRNIAGQITEQHGAEYTKHRALNVARTESSHALNAGHSAGIEHVAEESGGAIDGMEWLSILGSTTRDTHEEADGQIIPIGGKFKVGGYEARWPGDRMLPVQERAQCQCSLLSSGPV